MIAAVTILIGVAGLAWWFGSRDLRVPDTSPVWSFDGFVGPEEAVVELDEKGDYHLYLSGREDYEGHVQRPLKWDLRKARRDFSVPLEATRDEPGGTFRIWFGSVTRQHIQGDFKTSWFIANGKQVSREDLAPLAAARGVDLERWTLQVEPNSMQLRLVGGFEDVRNGFIARGGQVFIPGASEPLVRTDTFMGEAEQTYHTLTANIPGASFENFLMTVDLAWGDRQVRLDPRVGARGNFGDFFTEIIFLEPFRMGAALSRKGPFATSFNRQNGGQGTSTTMAFFASDPAWYYFLYPEFIPKTGRTAVRYFSPTSDLRAADLRDVSVPVAPGEIDHILLHWRHRRCRAVFPLRHLPVPDLEGRQ